MLIHEGRDLVHVEGNIRNLPGLDAGQTVDVFGKLLKALAVWFHFLISSVICDDSSSISILYSIENQMTREDGNYLNQIDITKK